MELWQGEYNHRRPHRSPGYLPPSEFENWGTLVGTATATSVKIRYRYFVSIFWVHYKTNAYKICTYSKLPFDPQ
ncbi:transposase [bacterium]|nr:transposase [bacterium]